MTPRYPKKQPVPLTGVEYVEGDDFTMLADDLPTGFNPYTNGPAVPGTVKLFDITCVIGSVYSDPDGSDDPRAVAFLKIEEYTRTLPLSAVFSFPNEDGSINHITVETEVPNNR